MTKKEDKIVYIDDNSTIADMHNVGGKRTEPKKNRPRSAYGEKLRTFFSAVKFMLFPMLVATVILAIIFLIMSLIFS